MGCSLGCSLCCKKKKKIENKAPPVGRKDTKFIAQSFKHIKIEIKNNNDSNSKEIPLINNFFKNALNNEKDRISERSNSESQNSKSKKSEEIKKNIENNKSKDIIQNNDEKEIKNIIDENVLKGNIEQISEGQNSKSFKLDKNNEKSEKSIKSSNKKSEKSKKSSNKKTEKSKISSIIDSNRTKKTKKSNISYKSNESNKAKKTKELNLSKSKDSKDSKNSKLSKKELIFSKELKLTNDMKNLNESNELKNLLEKKDDNNISISNEGTNNISNINNTNIDTNNNTDNNSNKKNKNKKVKILNNSIIVRNNTKRFTKLEKKDSSKFKSNKELSQVFVDYKTFIKGKPYSELYKDYKDGIDIGEGGFGKVRTIIHKKSGQLRAMKLIKKSKEFNLDEIENLMLLNHPNILKLFGYYYDEHENIYIITEYIKGEELFNKIQQQGRFTEEDSAVIIKSVLQAIAFCHSRGIIHRDLKPENILVPTGKSKIDYTLLKIIDFGASVLKKDDGKITFRFGTPYYIAPEVLLESYNEKCDVWSIGVILYLLLVGRAPFDGDDDNIICQKIISEDIDYNSNKLKSLSSESIDFMKKLLEKNPDKRISSSQALEHPWIKKFAPHTKVNKAFSKKIYKNLSNFREESQLSTAVVTFITNYLMSDDELKLLKKLFFELDVKGVGVITREELFKGMEECYDKKITREEVDKIFGNIDYDNNGTISFDEFVKAAIDKKKLLTDEKLRAAFALFDRNGDGDIEAKELKEVIGDENNTEDNIWMQMIKEVDLDGNGVIDFEEFKTMMQKLCA